jgi:2-C-methyl-D-erythritol 4-phosphate cytidylyltransferase
MIKLSFVVIVRRRIGMDKSKTVAIILAAGQGKRMNSKTPKQYLMLRGKPILYYSLKVFENSEVDNIVLVVGDGEVKYCKEEIVDKYNFKKVIYIVEGGAQRYHSVYNGLNTIKGVDYVLIHDGARPFITEAIIANALLKVVKSKACVVGMPVKDTIKIANDHNYVVETPNRALVWTIQTPQVFEFELIKKAYDMLIGQNITTITDDAMVLEKMLSYPIELIKGSYRNIKITTIEDLQIANAFLSDIVEEN